MLNSPIAFEQAKRPYFSHYYDVVDKPDFRQLEQKEKAFEKISC